MHGIFLCSRYNIEWLGKPYGMLRMSPSRVARACESDLDLCFWWWSGAPGIEWFDHDDLLDYTRVLDVIADLVYSGIN